MSNFSNIKKRLSMSTTLPLGSGGGADWLTQLAQGHSHHHVHSADGSCCGHDHSHDHHHAHTHDHSGGCCDHDHDDEDDTTNPAGGCC